MGQVGQEGQEGQYDQEGKGGKGGQEDDRVRVLLSLLDYTFNLNLITNNFAILMLLQLI